MPAPDKPRHRSGYTTEETEQVRAVCLTVAVTLGAYLDDVDLHPGTNDQDRRRPIEELDGELLDLWDYDEDEREWSEDYRLGRLTVGVSNFLVSTVDAFLDDVVDGADPDLVKHMRLAAVQRCLPFAGAEVTGRPVGLV